jgi:NAD(P)-dependent dehydrogenase (short-subunit alcohol dehydrogenase family)
MKKTWFITGASRGFGRIWAEAALKRGDQVTATARKLADVADLRKQFGDAVLPLALDVTNAEQVQQVVQQAYAHFGRLDVLVNNAGTSLFAATEEASDEQIRDLFDANYPRHGSGAASSSSSDAETRERTHPRGFERSWDYCVAADRLLLCHEMGGGSYARITGAGGETLRHQGDAG